MNYSKKLFFLLKILFIYLFSINISFADLKKDLINRITAMQTLSFNFEQKIAENKEEGKCIIKYPLLMRCDYQNIKQKIIISNGKSVAVIKKKYKKIYLYPIKKTPLFTILKKEKILNLVRKNIPVKVGSNIIVEDKNSKNKLKIIFDENSLDLKGWNSKDAYSNDVSFVISNLIINNNVIDDFFKIPQEKDL